MTEKPARVLIVDDELSFLSFVDRVLRGAGYHTAVASSGAAALDVVRTFGDVDILLTDYSMPGMSGAELARCLRVGTPGLKVLYLTGFSDRLFGASDTLSRDEAFLDKPCTMDGLLQAVSLLHTGGLTVDRPIG